MDLLEFPNFDIENKIHNQILEGVIIKVLKKCKYGLSVKDDITGEIKSQ